MNLVDRFRFWVRNLRRERALRLTGREQRAVIDRLGIDPRTVADGSVRVRRFDSKAGIGKGKAYLVTYTAAVLEGLDVLDD